MRRVIFETDKPTDVVKALNCSILEHYYVGVDSKNCNSKYLFGDTGKDYIMLDKNLHSVMSDPAGNTTRFFERVICQFPCMTIFQFKDLKSAMLFFGDQG